MPECFLSATGCPVVDSRVLARCPASFARNRASVPQPCRDTRRFTPHRDQAFAFLLAGYSAGLRKTLRAIRRFNETTGLLLPENCLRWHLLTGSFSQARMPPCAGNAPRPVTDGGAGPPAPRS